MKHRIEGGHFLKSTKTTTTPNNFMFVSAVGCDPLPGDEPNEVKQSLRLWHGVAFRFYDGQISRQEERTGETSVEFLHWCYARQHARSPLWIYSYDAAYALSLLRLWNALDDGTFSVGPIHPGPEEKRVRGNKTWKGFLCLESAPVFASLMGRRGPVTVCDVQNYFNVGLGKLSQSMGRDLPSAPPDSADDSAHLEHLRATTNVIKDVMVRLLRNWRDRDCGTWQKTAASMAFSSYKRFLDKCPDEEYMPTPIVGRNEECERIEKLAFHGGRSEPFYLGEVTGRYHKLDISSLYPSVMAEQDFPMKRLGRHVKITPGDLWREMAFNGACASVTINSPDETYPIHHSGYLTYARGRFTTCLAGVELKRAIDRQHVELVHEAVIYKVGPLFRPWVHHWYGIKKEATALGLTGFADRQLSKLILNSLYGKFSQRGNRWVTKPGYPCPFGRWGAFVDVDHSGNVKQCRAIANVRQEWEEGEPPAHYFPAISAFVTAAARERMRELLSLLPPRSCVYLGTDMVIVDDEGYDALKKAGEVHPDELGKLKYESTHYDVNICAPMWYCLDGEWTRNGNWGRAKQNSKGEWCYDSTERLPSLLATQPDGTVTVRTHLLAPTERWAKGVVGPDGWVEPWTLTTGTQWPNAKQQAW